jgi:hypothetical protein
MKENTYFKRELVENQRTVVNNNLKKTGGLLRTLVYFL